VRAALPLADIRALTRSVRWVMKGGQVVVDNQSGDQATTKR
jgi:hypothetical protein